MKIYQVGGALRDELLGLSVQDRDYVVVGATVEDMIERGFKPVGNDFPVFLHPKTHEEYALARTERKKGLGYKGFSVHASPEVTLEEDLRRRDLTINAMARGGDGQIIDPYGGIKDCQQRVLRHVSEAFVEDPVRILRVARFLARFKRPFGFTLAPETLALMKTMSANGEVDALVPERVWQELSRALMETTPSAFFEVLEECGALNKIVPQLAAYWPTQQHRALEFVDQLAALKQNLNERFAGWLLAIFSATENAAPSIEAICQQLKCPRECKDLTLLAYQLSQARLEKIQTSAQDTLTLLEHTDALRRPERYREALTLVLLLRHASLEEATNHPLYRAASLLQPIKLPSVEELSVPEKIALMKELRLQALQQNGFN
ncbi:MAG: multifunctional CCA tRNA nucleotidyl transferase/2'3'-cyclic phosphodiesterase/2'nucleotidase/phosphatase [Betaproteobacteria bacterium]|nr:multifunctional CCA tRNA nucleotidyl transferase/2'3'-cyclic phosphodiesterase/2'nucleotidase/phosphatase [Betaproteobacteria bacterium]